MAVSATPAYAAYAGRNFYIERPRLAAELSYRVEADDRQGPYISAQSQTQTLAEHFDIETAGWIYHPALMTYTLMLSPEFRQRREEHDPGTDRSEDSILLGYKLRMDFLESKPYTIGLFALKENTSVSSSLATTTDYDTESYGATLRLKYEVLPTILSWTHTTTDQSGFYVSSETRDEARVNMRHFRPSNDTTFDLNWTTRVYDTLGTISTSTDTESLTGSLTNQFRITPDSRVLLSSSLVFRDIENIVSGTAIPNYGFESSGYSLSETLNWQHTNNFSTYYNLMYTLDEYSFSGFDLTSFDILSGGVGLSHSLYENLITTANINASDSSSGFQDYGGDFQLAYQRSIPGGMIYADLGQSYRVYNRAFSLAYEQVIGESHTLATGDVTLLDNRGVDPASVVVTNADRTIVYVVDIDYTLEVAGTSVRISRTTFGSIPEGGNVLVSYRYLTNPAYDSSDYGQFYRIGFYLWDAWRINYRYASTQEDFIAGNPPDVLNEDTRHLVDSELAWKWSTTRFLYEDHSSTNGLSTERWRLEETLVFRPRNTLYLSMGGYLGHTTLKDLLEGEEDFYGFRGDLQWQVNRWSRAKIEGFYANVDGTSVKTQTAGFGARWEWFYGIWNGEATYRYFTEDDLMIAQTRNFHSLFFSVKRSLF